MTSSTPHPHTIGKPPGKLRYVIDDESYINYFVLLQEDIKNILPILSPYYRSS